MYSLLSLYVWGLVTFTYVFLDYHYGIKEHEQQNQHYEFRVKLVYSCRGVFIGDGVVHVEQPDAEAPVDIVCKASCHDAPQYSYCNIGKEMLGKVHT